MRTPFPESFRVENKPSAKPAALGAGSLLYQDRIAVCLVIRVDARGAYRNFLDYSPPGNR
jgi:hypothetical protein